MVPFGIGYCFGVEEAMRLDVDFADVLMERKIKMVNAMSNKKR
jgi:hypothetical protein